MLILGITACGQGRPPADQNVGTATITNPTPDGALAIAATIAVAEPTVNSTPETGPTVAAVIAAAASIANPTPDIKQTVAAVIAAASPTTPSMVGSSTDSNDQPARHSPTRQPAGPPRSIENDPAFDYRSITFADKTQRWTCIGANRPRINITHPAADTVATAVAGRTTEDKDTVINGKIYKLAWAAWSSDPSWTPEEHALNVRHEQALALKYALVSSDAKSFSVSKRLSAGRLAGTIFAPAIRQ